MLFDREDVSFLMQVVDAGVRMSASYMTETSVLDCLEAFQRSLAVVWKNDWSSIIKEGADQ